MGLFDVCVSRSLSKGCRADECGSIVSGAVGRSVLKKKRLSGGRMCFDSQWGCRTSVRSSDVCACVTKEVRAIVSTYFEMQILLQLQFAWLAYLDYEEWRGRLVLKRGCRADECASIHSGAVGRIEEIVRGMCMCHKRGAGVSGE